MSKPLSFGLGKPKAKVNSSKPSTASQSRPSLNRDPLKRPLHGDSDSEDDAGGPRHESVTGFDAAAGGTISAAPANVKEERVIKNAGNSDWRTRGRRTKSRLPAEEQARRAGQTNGDAHEVDEVSKKAGLQFAAPKENGHRAENTPGVGQNGAKETEAPKERSEDDAALYALLNDGDGKRRTDLVIQQAGNESLFRPIDEAAEFQEDLASRPDSSTLEEYAVMPVEDFGLAMLRGMGTKRKANGQPVPLENGNAKPSAPKPEKQQRAGYLGIGAKGVPAGAEIELGAWGKADMRRNKKGEGLYTPVMLRDKQTGETITEEEFERRSKEAKSDQRDRDDDRRDRKTRSLQDRGRDGASSDADHYKQQMNAFSKDATSQQERRAPRGERSGHSRRDRSSSRDRRRRYREEDDYGSQDDRDRGLSDRYKGRHHDKGYREDRKRSRDRHARRRSRDREERHRPRDRSRDGLVR